MGRNRRVTLRCVTEDLTSGWLEPADLANAKRLRELAQQAVVGDAPDSTVRKQLKLLPPLSQLRHPLVLAFDDQFAGEDDAGTLRETIKAVKDRQWFKQTYSARWRGAAAVLQQDGAETAWLSAAGYHREGSPEDFYEEFARRCHSGSDAFLPAAEDATLRRIEVKVARLEAWKLQLHLSALVLLDAAINNPEHTHNTTVLSPDSTELLTLSMLVVQTNVEDVVAHELVVVVPAGWEHQNLYARASIIVKTAIEPQLEAWTSAPLNHNAESHWTVLTEEAMFAARATAESGTLSASARPGEVRLGTIAHYSHQDHIAYATVHGEAIRAMCGHWFVPTADHESKPVCATCQENYARTPA